MTNSSNDVRVQRRRQEDVQADLDRRVYGSDNGAPVLVGKTSTDGSYPVAAQAVYKVELYLTGGELKEGATPTFTDLGMAEYATNLGSAVPGLGQLVRLDLAPGGRYTFEFNG